MKFVLFSDLHLDAPFAWAGPDLGRRRRQALRDTLASIIKLTRRVEADALLCAGDLYEQERFSPDTAEFLRGMFEQLHPMPVYIAPGNHDWYGPESLYREVNWTPNVHIFQADHLEAVTLEEGLTLWGAAHRAPANTDGFLDAFTVDRGGVHFALFHGSERSFLAMQEQGKVAHAPFSEAQIEQAGLHYAFVGHYHLPRDTARYSYPGNPDPLTFGESGQRAAVVVTVSPRGKVACERHCVNQTTLHDVAVDVTGCRNLQEVRERVASKLQGLDGMARVTLQGELDSDVDLRPRDMADAAPWMDAILPRTGDIRVAYDFDAIARERTVRGQFVQDVRAADLSEDEKQRVLITGLRALDGRSDLEVS